MLHINYPSEPTEIKCFSVGIIDPKPKDHPLLNENAAIGGPMTTEGPTSAGVVQSGTKMMDNGVGSVGGERPDLQNGFPDGYSELKRVLT